MKALYEKRDRIAYITFNRPEAKNAIDPEMQDLLVEIWTDFRDDPETDVAIVTGAGDAFCAGFLPAWLDKKPPHEALSAGCRLAAQALGMVGARPAL